MAAFPYEAVPHDWTALASAALVVLDVAVAACLVPTDQAVRTPTVMLLKRFSKPSKQEIRTARNPSNSCLSST